MTSIADGSVLIQTSSESNLSPPTWFGEVVLRISHFQKNGILTKISEEVRFARRRFGHYEVIDFLAILFGYAISGERTLEGFYEHLQPFAIPFMALFRRDRLPSRSAFSRFLAALTKEPVEALRTLFLDDLLERPLSPDKQTGSLVDPTGCATRSKLGLSLGQRTKKETQIGEMAQRHVHLLRDVRRRETLWTEARAKKETSCRNHHFMS